MTVENLSKLVGGALSIIFLLLPFLKIRFDLLSTEWKTAVTAGVTILAGVVIYALSCANLFTGFGVACTKQGFLELLSVVLNTLLGLATVYVTMVRAVKDKYPFLSGNKS